MKNIEGNLFGTLITLDHKLRGKKIGCLNLHLEIIEYRIFSNFPGVDIIKKSIMQLF